MRRKKGIDVFVPNDHPPSIPDDQPLTEDYFRQLFALCADVIIDTISLPYQGNGEDSSLVTIIYSEGLCDIKQINQYVVPKLSKTHQTAPMMSSLDMQQYSELFLKEVTDDRNPDDLVKKVFEGELLLFFHSLNKLYWMELSDPPQRAPEESNTEVSVKGPRDGFTEEPHISIGLIRKRLKTNRLAVEEYRLGDETHTKVNLLFLKNRINPDTLEEIRTKLSNLEVQALVSNTQLEDILTGTRIPLFPLFEYTGRPDFAVNALLHGKFVIFVEGSPSATIAPVTLTYLFNTPEDVYSYFWYSAFTRLMRLFGFILALFLPGFWIALITYHQDQLPYTLVATLVLSRQGVPIPVPFEAIVMLLLFELFREAGMRLPMAFGQTLSVVGGLIIGQAAISAGLTAPGILVVVAMSVLSTFSLVNQDLVGTVSLLRLLILLVSGMAGLFGFFIMVGIIALYLTNLRSFGVYYLEPISPPVFQDLWKVVFRIPWGKWGSVPKMLQKTRSNKEN
ncbi:probable spore germination protein [Brevibacillus brevis NBRC 100599]|uniref:Probable spore germination protein n=1 Tax=Brevibacillus brevis (strain 47 / JCM 6285 / NBRC 100599) TaxID=358681 RepID=C0Z5C4_BREBN|nr:spore germination protein [Brevibacillus brevis]BAH46030.1 probable spore germination protein [Brevibacillus brevis NBRC 100599]